MRERMLRCVAKENASEGLAPRTREVDGLLDNLYPIAELPKLRERM
jgi:hypothetical protein